MIPHRIRMREHTRTSRALLTALLGLIVSPALGGQAFFVGVGDLPGGEVQSYILGLSADGSTAVGTSLTGTWPGGDLYEGYRWTREEGIVALGGDLNGAPVRSHAFAVSADGSVIVGETDSDPFVWTPGGGMVELEDVAGEVLEVYPRAISHDGSVVFGYGDVSNGRVAIRWTAAGGAQNLGALVNEGGGPDSYLVSCSADGSKAAGNSIGEFVQPTRWTAQTQLVGLGDVPGGAPYALGVGMSADGGTIVGPARHNVNFFPRDEAFVWRPGRGFFFLDPQRAAQFESTAWDCSADGSVIVGYFEGFGGPMIWDEVHGMRSIGQLLVAEGVNVTGWLLGSAYSVSDDGQVIAGNGRNPDGNFEGWVARLPRKLTPQSGGLGQFPLP